MNTNQPGFRVRLYFVDCPEASASSLALRRLREQTRYFGLSNAATAVRFGRTAAAFTRKHLKVFCKKRAKW